MVFVFDWSDFGSGNGSTTLVDGVDTLGVTVTSDSNFHVSSIGGADALRSSGQTSDKSTVIAFDQEVEDVSFELFDIDQGSSSSGASTTWDDQVTLIARDADGNIIPLPASVISNTAHHSVTVNADGSITIDSEGNSNPGVEGSGAVDTVSFTFEGPIASIEIVHQVGDDGAGRAGVIGVSNLTVGSIADTDTDNVVDGTDGDDIMLVGFVDGDNDTIDGADGDDDTIFGYGGDDTIEAGAGTNTIDGGTGDDTFIGGAGADAFEGGSGQDNIDYSNSGAAVTVDLSTSSLSGGDADNDTILGGIDGIIGSDFDDVLTGFDAEGTDPTDTFTNELFGGAGDDVITGLGGDDRLDGGADDDELYGGAGDDSISGGTGSDTLEGGLGADELFGGADDDDILTGGGDTAEGGSGDDVFTVDASDPSTDAITIIGGETGEDLSDPTNGGDGDVLDLSDQTADLTVNLSAPEDGTVEGLNADVNFTEIENIELGSGDDTVTGSAGNDTIGLGEGADTIDAGAGDDTIDFGTDPDGTPDGDVDTLVLGNGDGGDTIQNFDTPVLDADGNPIQPNDLLDVTGLDDAGGDPVNTNDVVVTVNGDGDPVLTFPNGESVTLEGADPDTFIDPVSGDPIIPALVAIGIPLADPNEGPVDGTAGDDVITPTSGAGGGVFVDAQGDSVDGADGDDDIINGFAGDDIIDGGAGSDEIFAGDDADTILLQDGEFGGDDIEGGEGGDDLDTLDASGVTEDVTVTFTGDEAGTLTGDTSGDTADFSEIEMVVTGSGDDTIDGSVTTGSIDVTTGAGDDTITGGTGDDTVGAGDGNDTITTGDGSDTVVGGDGDDVIDTSGPNSTGANIALDLGFPGLVTPDVDPFNDRDVVDGGAGNDTITTGDDADTIFGGTGDDIIDGGIDADSIDGGDGNDTIIGGEGSDVIDGGAGDDVIYAALDPSFPDSLNIPDEIDPVLNNGDDLVHGGTGNDTIYGADDNDTLHGDEGDDVLYGGIDDDVLFGGDGQDQLFGGDASDTLDGGNGFDILDGGRDDDTLIVGTGDVASGGHGDDVFTIDAAASGSGLTDINIVGGETGEANQPDNDDTTNDNFPGAPNEFGDVLDLTNLIVAGQLDPTDVIFDDPSHESGSFTFTNDDGELVTVNFSEIENVIGDGIVCFTHGTMIVTENGEKAIEDLVAGDKIMTKDHGLQELRWIGSRKVPAKDNFAPIMIKAGAMANDRDLLVSPQHRMVVEGWKSELLFGEREVLAAAKHLVNGDTIYVQSGGMVEYFHMLFDTHEIVFGNGAASESFHPGEVGINALSNEARDEIFSLFPELRDNVESYGPAARTSLKGHEAKVLAKNPDFLS